MSILFHALYPVKALPKKTLIKKWVVKIVSGYDKKLGIVNIIFINDEKILELNKKYLDHDYLTDILTFNYNTENKISGDIYISLERVEDNSHKFNCTFQDEILRVIIHGFLHLLGFNDISEIQKNLMRQLEDEALREFHFS